MKRKGESFDRTYMSVWFTRNEKQLLKQAAQHNGVSVSKFIKNAALLQMTTTMAEIVQANLANEPKPTEADLLGFKCPCGCCHLNDYGACPTYEIGGNGRCVYCDHGLSCHSRDSGRRFYNGPVYLGVRPLEAANAKA